MKDGPKSPLEVLKLLLCSKRAHVSIAINFLGKKDDVIAVGSAVRECRSIESHKK